MINPLRKLLTYYVEHSSRFDRNKFECYVDEVGEAYKCPACGELHNERPLICERCFYPIPFFGGSPQK